MSSLGPVAYLLIFASTAALSLLLVPVAMRVAIRYDILDHPGGYKQHGSPVPYLGGIAVVVAFSVAVLAAATIRPPVTGFGELVALLGLAVLLSLVGLIDDLRGLGLWSRLVVMVAAAIGLYSAGVRTELFGDLWWLDALITVLWVVGITNAFNLLDNMDGLSAGIAAIASGFFFLIAAVNGQFLVAALSVALVGCAVGFLRHNRFPAKIYMGDAGSVFFGFMLAAVGIKLRFEAPREVTASVPILILGVAIFDTALVILTRTAAGRNPFRGSRDHVSHRLVGIGLSVRSAVSLVYGVSAGLGWLAVIMSRLEDVITAYVLLSGVLAAATAAFAYLVNLGTVPSERERAPHVVSDSNLTGIREG